VSWHTLTSQIVTAQRSRLEVAERDP